MQVGNVKNPEKHNKRGLSLMGTESLFIRFKAVANFYPEMRSSVGYSGVIG